MALRMLSSPTRVSLARAVRYLLYAKARSAGRGRASAGLCRPDLQSDLPSELIDALFATLGTGCWPQSVGPRGSAPMRCVIGKAPSTGSQESGHSPSLRTSSGGPRWTRCSSRISVAQQT